MQLTRFSDLSLHLLLYLAGRERTETPALTVRGAAKILNVPYTHLVKVVHRLGQLGWIATTKGYGGGIRLAKVPAEVHIGTVLRQTEPAAAILDCSSPPCILQPDCSLQRALKLAYDQFFQELDRYSLADLAKDPPLLGLVQISLPGDSEQL